MKTNGQGLFRDNAPFLILFQRLLDPALSLFWLFILSQLAGEPFGTPCILLAAISFLLVLPIFKATGLYRSYRSEAPTAEVPRILVGWLIVLGMLSFLGYFTKTSAMFSRSLVFLWAGSVPLLLCGTHLGIRIVLRQMRAAGRNTRTAVIAGLNEMGHHLAHQIQQSPYLGLKLYGFFDDRYPQTSKSFDQEAFLGTLEELPEYVRQQSVDVVYVALSIKNEDTVSNLIKNLQDTTACVYFIPNIFMFSLMQAATYQINGLPVIAVWEIPFSGVQGMLKRLIDVAVSSVVLIALSPVMLAIAIGVKLSSPGPILFKQRRYGLNGQEITVYKFRSMRVIEDGQVIVQAKRDDPRVTPFGKVIRKTSLDELPQLINVLQGRMSLVGPRPHAVAHNEEYRKLIHGYMLRHKVKPGITGWAQIHGLRGETATLDKMQQRVEYDLQYLNNWSLGLDLIILLRTVLVFFERNNAY